MTSKVNFEDKNKNKKVLTPSTDFSEIAFFIAINILVVPFSAYQTYIGYKADVAGNIYAAVTIAAISGILFAAMNFGIRDRRLKGKRHAWQVFMYIVPLGFSFAGNFNAFYTNQMKSNLTQQSAHSYFATLTTTKNDALKIHEDSSLYSEYTQQWRILKQELEDEFTQPPSGWGKNCNDIYIRMKAFTGAVLAGREPSSPRQAINWLEPSRKLKEDPLKRQYDEIRNNIQSQYDRIKEERDSMMAAGTWGSQGASLISDIESVNNSIGSMIKTQYPNFNFTLLSPSKSNDIGTVKHAFYNGFVEMPYPSATIFSLFLALIIDLAALLYILFFVPYGKINTRARIHSGPRSLN